MAKVSWGVVWLWARTAVGAVGMLVLLIGTLAGLNVDPNLAWTIVGAGLAVIAVSLAASAFALWRNPGDLTRRNLLWLIGGGAGALVLIGLGIGFMLLSAAPVILIMVAAVVAAHVLGYNALRAERGGSRGR